MGSLYDTKIISSYVPMIRSGALLPFAAFLREIGSPVQRMLWEARLPIDDFDDSESLLPLFKVQQFLENVARRENLPTLGLDVSSRTPIYRLGNFGCLLARSLTLYEAIDTACRMIGAFNSGVRMWLRTDGDQTLLFHCNLSKSGFGRQMLDQAAAVAIVEQFRRVEGERWNPAEVHLRMDYARDVVEHPALAGLPLRFGQDHTCVSIPSSHLSRPLRAVRESDPQDLRRKANFLLESAPSTDFVDSFKQLIVWQISSRRLGVDLAADAWGICVQTLQNRFRAQGIDYSRLVEEVRFGFAIEMLKDPGLNIKDIAFKLGYANIANFNRAFHRWTGVAPSVYRRQHCRVEGLIVR